MTLRHRLAAPARRRLWAWLSDSPEARASFRAAALRQGLDDYRVFGDPARLQIDPTASVNDALFNTESGDIVVGANAFFGFRVLVLTGTHELSAYGVARKNTVPGQGHDITIESDAWVASGAILLGPCTIGASAVVAAGAVVTGDVPAHAMVGGVPARLIRRLQ